MIPDWVEFKLEKNMRIGQVFHEQFLGEIVSVGATKVPKQTQQHKYSYHRHDR